MKRALWIVVLALCACDSGSGTTTGPTPKQQASANKPKPAAALPMTKAEMIAAVQTGAGLKDGLLEIADDDFSPRDVTIRIRVPPDQPRLAPSDAEMLTTVAAGEAVKALVAKGWNPRERMTIVRVKAYQPAPKSVTGGEMVYPLGAAHYDYNEDKVLFEAPDSE